MKLNNGQDLLVGLLEHKLYAANNKVILYTTFLPTYQEIRLGTFHAIYFYNEHTKNITLYVKYNEVFIDLEKYDLEIQDGTFYIQLLSGEKLSFPSRKRYNRSTDRNQTYLTIGDIQHLVQQAVIGADDKTIYAPYNPEK